MVSAEGACAAYFQYGRRRASEAARQDVVERTSP
jgi:hypothetical protein